MNIFKEYRELAESFNKCKNDLDRLKFLKDNNTKLKAVLDNDITMVDFIKPINVSDEDFEKVVEDISLNDFDEYHYYSNGCLLLFKFSGITAESV